MESKEKNTIKSSYKVFYILEILAVQGRLGLSELSELTGFTKSTTQRIVNTLKDLKYIVQDTKTLEYYPSIKLHQLGNKAIVNFPIKKIAKPHLLRLYDEVNETVNLAILNYGEVVYLDKLVSTSPLRVEIDLGTPFPLYCSSLGKSMAAFSDDAYTFEGKYIKFTENTISSDKEFYDNLENIRKLGYSIDNEEYVKGLTCIAVPILDTNNMSIASISISIPTIRYNEEMKLYCVNLLKNYARKIENEIF